MTANVDRLRQQVDHLRYAELVAAARLAWEETGEIAALPLLALAHAQLGQPAEAAQYGDLAQTHLAELDLDARVDLAGACCAR